MITRTSQIGFLTLLLIHMGTLAVKAETEPRPAELEIVVAIVDRDLDVRPAPKFRLEAENRETGQVYRASTGFDGEAKLALPPGNYRISSIEPLIFEGESYEWRAEVVLSAGGSQRLELSNDNALQKPVKGRAGTVGGGTSWVIGGGFVSNVADLDDGTNIDGSGAFFTLNAILANGVLLQFTSSASEDDESSLVEDELYRAGLSIGYMFRRDETLKPFVHAGLSLIAVEETVLGVTRIDDDSQVFMLGGGLLVGPDHHNFFLDIVRDFDHELLDRFGLGIRSSFDLVEVHLGYAYRF